MRPRLRGLGVTLGLTGLLSGAVGCAPAYLVSHLELQTAQQQGIAAVSALRVHDGRIVGLRVDSLRADPNPDEQGAVRARGLGSRARIWRAGAAVTCVGIGMSLLGLGLAVGGIAEGGDITEGSARGAGLMIFGATLSSIGDIMGLIVGPALWGYANSRGPVEVPLSTVPGR